MGRSIRVEYVGAMYHVMNRGNARGVIFRDEKCYDFFKRWLGKVCEKAGWKVHAYTLMPNHYHLLIEIRRKTLVKGMQLLNAEYTRYFNRRYRLSGPLFQGRYKATLVEGKAGYLLTVTDYIHLNFARAGICESMEDLVSHPETSVGCYVRGKFPEWMEWSKVMGSIGQENLGVKQRKRYYEHLKTKCGEMKGEEEVWRKLRRSWCWAGESLTERFKKVVEGRRGESRSTELWQRGLSSESEETKAIKYLKEWSKNTGKNPQEIRVRDKYRLGVELREKTCIPVKWIASELKMVSERALMNGMSLIKTGKLK